VNGQHVDYTAVFHALPGMVALLDRNLMYIDVNEDFRRLTGRSREQLIGRYIFDVFPENPGDRAAAGMRETRASLLRVIATGKRDTMALLRYDIEDPHRPGHWQEHFWSPVNAPVLGPDGRVALVVHRVEEVTQLIRARGGPGGDRSRVLEAELYTPSRELQEANENLRGAGPGPAGGPGPSGGDAALPQPCRTPPGGRALPARGWRPAGVR
jgi:hypothetical protein